MKRKMYLAALAVVGAAPVGSVYASKHAENDALAIAAARIDSSQAVSAAEVHMGGKDHGHSRQSSQNAVDNRSHS